MFSNLGAQNQGGTGLFGQPQQQQQQQQGGGLFGGQNQQQQGGQGLFGTQQAGLFGTQPAGASLSGISGLLGGGQQTPGSGMFGGQTQQGIMGQQQQQNSGLFGQPQMQAQVGGLFQTAQTGGLFASQQQQQPQQNMMLGQTQQPQQQAGLFGNTGLGMFGQPQQQQQQPQLGGGGLFGQQQPTTGFNQGSFLQPQQNQVQPQGLFSGGQQQQSNISPTWTQQSTFNMPAVNVNNFNQVVQTTDDSASDSNMDQNCTRVEDSISQIVWSFQQPRMLAVSTWEGKVRIYELVQNMQNMNQQTLQERKVYTIESGVKSFNQTQNTPNPLLCLDWKPDGQMIFVGTGMDNTVRAIQVGSGQNAIIGQHNGPVIAVYWVEQIQSVLSVSTDQTMKIWDLNMPGQFKYQLQFQHKPLVADFNYPILIIGFAQEKLLLIDLTQLQLIKNLNYFISPLGDFSRLTCVTLFPNRDGYGIGSVDGRGHMSSIITKTAYNAPNTYDFKNIMTFKAHKLEETPSGGGRAQSYFFPVNAIQFNSRNLKFMMTAGGEGQMIFWDYEAKNKIKTFQFNNNPITAAKVSHDRQFLAYALGNDFSKGPEGYNMNYQTKLCVHYIPENELKCAAR